MTPMDPEQAFLAVNKLLQEIWERTKKTGDLGFFCDIISYVPGEGSADPAMWYDWLAAAKMILTGQRLPDRERGALTPADVGPLDPEQAYLAMYRFIEEYWLRVSRPPEIGDLLGQMRYTPGTGTADPQMWQRWLTAIEKVRTS
jgi:hypothetical protein